MAADRNITIDLQCDAQLHHKPTRARIDVAIEPVPQGIAIPVCNPGPGIPHTALPPLFERFYRGAPSQAQSSAQSSQSTGLGLATVKPSWTCTVVACRPAARRVGGPGSGSCFRLDARLTYQSAVPTAYALHPARRRAESADTRPSPPNR
ncbi:sensor histidine kinase [Ralstonia pickettii]|nr:sensor histidine kinase [Ralstonia pickettii]